MANGEELQGKNTKSAEGKGVWPESGGNQVELIRILSQRSHTGNTAHAGVLITGAQGCVQGDL